MMNDLLKRLKSAIKPLPNSTPRILTTLLLAFTLMQVITVRAESSLAIIPSPQIKLRSASGSTISFFDANGAISNQSQPESRTLPRMVLFRNGKLTEPHERTLLVEISGLVMPPSGGYISIVVSTEHEINISEEGFLKRILVWQETKWITPSLNSEIPGQTITFHHEFNEFIESNGNVVITPTDYFKVNIRITPDGHPDSNPLFQFTQDFAFLMENEWLVNLPQVLEHTPGSAPQELILYYSDMFFPGAGHGSNLGLPREKINHYLGSELIPAILEAYQTESVAWGFPWYEDWRSYRPDDPAKRLSVAMTNGDTWYHGKAPDIGNAGISINLQSAENNSYNNLTESVISNFYHELFHNHQRNINLHLGGNGDIDGSTNAWKFFSEGTAVLASSVGQQEIQFSGNPGLRSYFINANGFLAGGGTIKREIYKSFHDINPYHGTIYWRFLYEHCGGTAYGGENPKAGMEIIRNALIVLYTKKIVDIQTSTNPAEHLPEIMNEAIERTTNCPFKNYEESLDQFARAIYSLKLENGRCSFPGVPTECGFYDPNNLYLYLPIQIIKYHSEEFIFEYSDHLEPEKIQSFGIRFIDVELGQSTDGNHFNLELLNEPNSRASFHLQIIKLKTRGKPSKLELDSAITIKPGSTKFSKNSRKLQYYIPEIELDDYDRLGLIITRTDNQEIFEDSGGYTIKLY